MATNKLENMFDEYDNSESLLASFSDKHLGKIAKGLNSSSKEEIQTTRGRVPQKIKSIVKIVRTVTENLNARLKAIGSSYRFDANSVTYSASQKYGKFNVSVADKTVNFNIKKLSKLPALELYTYITTQLYNAVTNELVPNGNEKERQEKLDELINSEVKQTNLSPKDFETAKTVISSYLEKFIKKYFPNDFKRYHNIANFVAGQVIAEMPEKELSQVLKKFFDFESINGFATDAVVDFLGYTEEARVNHISRKATELLIGKTDKNGKFIPPSENDELVALSYHEQAQELLSSSVFDKFRKIDLENGGFEYSNEIKVFCEDYARKFLNSNGLANIPIKFEAEGELGSFYDHGAGKQYFNINLDKVDSIVELVQTLSHELTHAVDASFNLAKGNQNEYGGGLLDDIGEDISRSGLDGKNQSLLKEIQKYCYYINPNERHARVNELSALQFMKNAGGNDPLIQNEIKQSVKRFITYQNSTIDYIQGNPRKNIPPLKDKIAEFESKFASLKSQRISKTAEKLFTERIKYLKNMLDKGFDLTDELESIKAAKEIIGIKEAEKQAQKRASEIVQEM